MKQLKVIFLLLWISICAVGQPHENNKIKKIGNAILLEYLGNTPAYDIDIQVEIDTTIGVRYEVTFEHGTSVLSHVAVFYKFSNPGQTIFYNFLTHKSFISTPSASTNDGNLELIGQAVIGKYTCTHIQQGKGNDYWMSPDVPGFTALVTALKNVDPQQLSMPFSGTIFTYGGLVRMTVFDHDTDFVGEIDLREATTGVYLKPGTFDVPSK